MDINNVPEVVVDSDHNYKFVTCEVSDDNGNKKLIVRAESLDSAGYHADIVRHLRKAVGLTVYCLGGGRIKVDPHTKIIRIWGKSGAFGLEPNRQETTAKLLQAAYPDWKIEVSN